MALLLSVLLWAWVVFVLMGEGGSVELNEEPSYLYVRETLRRNCTLPTTSRSNANYLEFTLDNGRCPANDDGLCTMRSEEVTVVDWRTLRLTRVVRGLQDAGEYTCWLHTPDYDDYEILDFHTVYVQYRPQPVQKVQCVLSYHWEPSITCHWDYGVVYNDHSGMASDPVYDIFVSAVLRTGLEPGPYIPCPQPLSQDITQCQWSGHYFRSAAHYRLEVNVTNTIRGDTHTTVVNITTRDIVQPAPLMFSRTVDKNSSCVKLGLSRDDKPRGEDRLYRINVTTDQGRTVRSIIGKSSEMSLCGLEPYTLYKVSVQCRAVDGYGAHGFWSDITSRTVMTGEGEPESSFEVTAGSYVRDPCDETGHGDVTILMKAIPRGYRRGVITGYRLVHSGLVLDVSQVSPISARVPDVSCNTSVWVNIFPKTKVGFSPTVYSSLLLLPGRTDTVQHFAVEVTGHDARAVWSALEVNPNSDMDTADDEGDAYGDMDLDTYGYGVDGGGGINTQRGDNVTIFWCVRNKTAMGPVCLEEVQWVSTAFRRGQHSIPQQFTHHLSPHDFLFGISRHGLSITWATCLFMAEASVQAPRGVRVTVVEQQLDVEWRPQQCSQSYPVHVIGYRLSVCVLQHCHESNDSVEVWGWQSNQQTVRVAPGHDYVVTVQAVLFEGHVGPMSAPVFVTVLPPPAKSLLSWQIALISVGIIVVVGITILFVCLCHESVRRRISMFGNLDFEHRRRQLQTEEYTDVETDIPEDVWQHADVSTADTNGVRYPDQSTEVTDVCSLTSSGEREEQGAASAVRPSTSSITTSSTTLPSTSTTVPAHQGLPARLVFHRRKKEDRYTSLEVNNRNRSTPTNTTTATVATTAPSTTSVMASSTAADTASVSAPTIATTVDVPSPAHCPVSSYLPHRLGLHDPGSHPSLSVDTELVSLNGEVEEGDSEGSAGDYIRLRPASTRKPPVASESQYYMGRSVDDVCLPDTYITLTTPDTSLPSSSHTPVTRGSVRRVHGSVSQSVALSSFNSSTDRLV